VPFDSLYNFRDIGGVPTLDGRTVNTGLVFRSDSLVNLSRADILRLRELHVRTVIDLRRATEVASYGRVAEDAWRYHHIPPEHPLWEESTYDEAAGPARYLADRYRELADLGRDSFGAALAVLAAPASTPAVVHCFAGKDRTGVLIALLLALVGVPDEAIAADYAISDEWSRTHAPDTLPSHWTAAPADAMLIFLAELRDRYGSVTRYAATAGLDETAVAALRTALLI
jgi:protein-tyrosine phosphatase